MTEPGDEIEMLRAERDELREPLIRRTGMLHGAISRILLKQSAASFPEELARTIDDRIAPVRWAAGWSPYVRRPRGYESERSPEERREKKGLPAEPYVSVEWLSRGSPEPSDIDALRAQRDDLREAVQHQIIMFQVALSNLYLQWWDVEDGHVDVAMLYEIYEKAQGTPAAILTADGVPQWLDGWFTSTEQQPYVGMTKREAVAAAERDGVDEVRLIDIPIRPDFPLDHKPQRLNFAVVEDRVVRAGRF